MGMSISFMLLLAICMALFCALESKAALDPRTPSSNQASHSSLRSQLQDAKLKLSRLESTVKECDNILNAKTQYIEGIEKKLEEITFDIDRVKDALSSFKDKTSHEIEILNLLEEEVQVLWAASRENNFEIHKLMFNVQDAEKRLNDVASKVEKMTAIVNEQWIQIQQLEQAAQLAEIRLSKVKSQLRYGRCSFVKFIKNFSSRHLETLKGLWRSNIVSDLKSYFPQAVHLFEKTFAAAQLYHHQLQGFVKQGMVKYDFPAVLANDEVVFLVASALVVFPLLSATMFLFHMSHLN